MQLEQGFSVSAPPDAVWRAFHDPALLVSCLPGASLRGPVEDGRLPLLFKVKLGPIAAAFAGEGALALDEAARSGVFSGQAADGKSNSRVKGEARFRAEAAGGGGTQVGVAVSFTITGSLAQFSREGIVRALADQLTQQFAANLQEQLAAGQADALPLVAAAQANATADAVGSPAATACAAGPAAAPTHTSESAPPAETPSLNLLTLLGALLKGYWRRFTTRKPS